MWEHAYLDASGCFCQCKCTIPGLYFYDEKSINCAKKLVPSKRGELEIVDVHKFYLSKNELEVFELRSDIKWLILATPKKC